MHLDWLLDLEALARHGSFSKAAEVRHTSQSSLSRRIQALEDWLGAELVDRTRHPVRLTAAGAAALPEFDDIARRLQALRSRLRQRPSPEASLALLVPHSLAAGQLAGWLPTLQRLSGGFMPRLITHVQDDVISRFRAGESELAIAYSHPLLPAAPRFGTAPWRQIGVERFVPMVAVGRADDPACRLPPETGCALAFLSYGSIPYIGRVIDAALEARLAPERIHRVIENPLVFSVREMVLGGQGVAWLPMSLIGRDVGAGQLRPAGGVQWQVEFRILLFRAEHRLSPLAERVWEAWHPEASGSDLPPIA